LSLFLDRGVVSASQAEGLTKFHLGFCFNPYLGTAGQGFIWRVDDLAWSVDKGFVAVAVVVVGFHRKDGLFLSVLGVGPDNVLVNVDDGFHCPSPSK